MSPCLLFNLRYTLCHNLSFLFTEIFNEGVLPPVWLTHIKIVTPVFKNGLVSDPANYRPISLTCIACRVMEKIVKDTVMSYLYDHKLINKAQHGFLTKHLTVSQLLECTNDWTLSMASCTHITTVDVKWLNEVNWVQKFCHYRSITFCETPFRSVPAALHHHSWCSNMRTPMWQAVMLNEAKTSRPRPRPGL